MSTFYGLHVVGTPLYLILWLFFLFSVLGVVIETVFCLAKDGVLESRVGLMYLPLSPIYGIGGVALELVLLPFVKQPVLMFFMGMLVGSVLEYVTSYVMEKLFHTVFWDYSDKPLNIHGRVCLQYSVYWGFLAMLLLYAVDPLTDRFVRLFSMSTGDVILTVAIVLTIPSIVLTLAAFTHLQHKLMAIQHHQPLPSGPLARLVGALAPDPVIINTFPPDESGDRVLPGDRGAASVDPRRPAPRQGSGRAPASARGAGGRRGGVERDVTGSASVMAA